MVTISRKTVDFTDGKFFIHQCVKNESDVVWHDAVPIPAENDYVIKFLPKGCLGSHVGKKHFPSVDCAEAYICFLALTGFSTEDL